MNVIVSLCLFLLIVPSACFSASEIRPPAPVASIDSLMNGAIQKGLIAGGVVLVGSRTEILYSRAYGRTMVNGGVPVTVDTIFDLASLTKVLAVTPAIIRLVEEGSLSLTDPVPRWLSELAETGKEEMQVWHLMTHTSGLDDLSFASDYPMADLLRRVSARDLKGSVGNRFRYADMNFILLAEIIRRASGSTLDSFVSRRIYKPLGMRDTGFHPEAETGRFAPTSINGSTLLYGIPQDLPARQLGGEAGHAGLFSTAPDLARFCQMMLGGGELNGVRVLSERGIDQMTSPYFSRSGKVVRGLGWDIDSPFSAPRGIGFSPVSFGHTGYSGGSIWIDPKSGLFTVLLTVRLNYANANKFRELRAELSTLAVESFGILKELLQDAD